MSNYKNGIIYKIIDNTSNKIYIGSTCYTLKQRLKNHESSYRQYMNGVSNNLMSFKILENNNYSIELLENYPSNSKNELELREKYYIENNICVNKLYNATNNKIINDIKTYDELKDKIKIIVIDHINTFQCKNCERIFKQKHHILNHLNKQNKCDKSLFMIGNGEKIKIPNELYEQFKQLIVVHNLKNI